MNILLIGQATLQWGRLEFGNMGNYYIIEPFIRELNNRFERVSIRTTFQMTREFCERENIETLPLEYYYAFRSNELEIARKELQQTIDYIHGNESGILSGYINEVLKSDIVIDLSGDMWGDNADIAGIDRFEVGLIKDYIPQLLGKPTYMLAGSPGPFDNIGCLDFAHKVFKGFKAVTNREHVSRVILHKYGFDTSNVIDCACPSFLFEGNKYVNFDKIVKQKFSNKNKPIVGLILCGWNFSTPPFSKWPREDDEYNIFVQVIEKFVAENNVNICLLSHSNGFPLPPEQFELQHGRDYYVLEKLFYLLEKSTVADSIVLQKDVLNVRDTKGIINYFDMLISGRVHGAIAGISQSVPTVIIDYGQEPKAHKLIGFAEYVHMEKYVANPNSFEDLNLKLNDCWNNRYKIKKYFQTIMPEVWESARKNFSIIDNIV